MKLPRAILFDMDGTLTEPVLDFPRIKAEMGIGSQPILEGLANLPTEEERKRAEQVLLKHERTAAEQSALNPGCHEVLAWLKEKQIPVGLITRNSRWGVELLLQRHEVEMGITVTRDDGPFKPSPWPLLHACENLGVQTSQTWMVGDGQYDVEAGIAAGIATVWLSHGMTRPFAAEPWKIVSDLFEFLKLLQSVQ